MQQKAVPPVDKPGRLSYTVKCIGLRRAQAEGMPTCMQTEREMIMTRRWRRMISLLMCMLLLIPMATADTFSFLPSRTEDGKKYLARPSTDLTTMLLIGYDHYDNGQINEEATTAYHLGGQSDFLLLVVFDHANRQIHQLQFDRDTMTQIKTVNINGQDAGTRKMQICLSHAYGRSREENNRNTVWAVENLMKISGANDGAQIDCYISMDISGINKLNELVGGVTVTIPNDDLIAIDPTLKGGETVTLTGMQAEYFTRYRYNTTEPTNEARMGRQRIYMDSLESQLTDMLRADINTVNRLLNGMGLVIDRSNTLDAGFGFTVEDYPGASTTDAEGHYLMANIGVDELAVLAAKVLDYELLPVETLEGEHSLADDGYIRYDLKTGCALEWTLNVFYTPVEEE